MGIHTLRFSFIWGVENVNRKYLDYNVEDEKTGWKNKGDHWKDQYLPDYWINKQINSWDVKSFFDKEGKAPPGYRVDENRTEYEGRVIKTEVRCERIMSDVWDNIGYALVYLPETTGKVMKTKWESEYIQERDYVWVCTGGGNDLDFTSVKCDAPQEIKNKYEKDEKFFQEQKIHKERMRVKADRRYEIRKDSIVQVVTGRKIKQGTFGKVFWFGDNTWGKQVGIAITPEKGNQTKGDKEYKNVYINTQFTSQSNCRIVGAESELNLFLASYAWEKGKANILGFIRDMNCPSEVFDKMSSIAEDEELSPLFKREALFKLFDENCAPE